MNLKVNREKIDAVRRMQDYIAQYYQTTLTLQDLADAAGYSQWQALRIFREITGQTPFTYIRDIRLAEATQKLRDKNLSVLDIALSLAFGSHEGFTKAFSRQFGCSPRQYRKTLPKNHILKGTIPMSEKIVFTQVIERPARRLLIFPAKNATHYGEYCDEVDSGYVWNFLESLNDGVISYGMSVWLPEKMRKPGMSEYCMAREMSTDFAGTMPQGFHILDLPPCKYMLFCGEPYEDGEQYNEEVAIVQKAIARYKPIITHYGWDWAPDDGPRFQFPPTPEQGYVEGLPVREFDEGLYCMR